MSMKRMLVLVAVHHAGSLTGAATALHYTTSAVSQQIALLEKEAGHALVERVPRGIRLTDAGRIVVRHAERMERVLEAAHRELTDLDELRSGTLRLGTFPTLTRSLLPRVLADYRSAHPQIEVRLLSETRERLRQRLESGDVELTFLWDFPWEPMASSGDEEINHLRDDPCVLLVPAGHPLADREEVAVWELKRDPWIVRATGSGRALLQRTCALADFEPRIVFEGQSYEEIQAMVQAQIGVALVPQSSVSGSAPELRQLSLGADAPVRRLYFARRRHSRLSAAAAAMYSVLRGL